MTLTVIIVTYNRPDCVRQCLECLMAQEPKPDQVIVVDASSDTRTRDVVAESAGVEYLRNESGYGHMTQSRNVGLGRARGDVVVFLDDDAYAHPGWLAHLLEEYDDESVGGVGGRALNNQPGEEVLGVDRIGRFTSSGELTGFFAANPARTLDVDHLVGCNMSFRRSVLQELGGLRDDYPGTELREETDICFRVRKLGYRLVFTPFAVVDHVGAPQGKGQRFDLRYAYYGQRNHMVLLLRNFGPFSQVVWRYLGKSLLVQGAFEFVKRIAAACARLGVLLAGTAVGMGVGLWLAATQGTGPVRRGPEAEGLRDVREANDAVQ